MSDCYVPIGKPDGALCIVEGYATGASIHEATGCAVAMALNAENLLPVARALPHQVVGERVPWVGAWPFLNWMDVRPTSGTCGMSAAQRP